MALTNKDAKTLQSIVKLAEQVIAQVVSGADPHMDIPSRSLKNTIFSRKERTLQMGVDKTRRHLFNLNQAKAFMQSLLVSSGTKQLIQQGKTTSLRGLYYMLKHTIASERGKPSGEETFNDQLECDTIIEDMELVLGSMREEMHLYATNRGNLAGELVLVDGKHTINCAEMGTGGYSIPSITEPSVIKFLQCNAKFILHVEKDTVWRRFHEDEFWLKHNCLLTHGGGQPPRGVRRLLFRLHHELGLPIYCVLDNDPWGYYIYSVIKQGSINLAQESKRMAIPNAKFMGIRSIDHARYKMGKSTRITLDEKDKTRATQIAKYPWFANKTAWQQEIGQMIANGFKMEVESLISKGLSFITEQYVPDRLKEKDWLD